MPFFSSIDNKKIFYEVFGEGEITIILIPGWAAPHCKELWKYQLELSSKYRIVLIDLVGYGKSERGREFHSMQLYAQDVRAVVDSLDLTEVILAGYSMGGAVMLEAEKLLSDRTIGLIAVDSLIQNNAYEKMEEEVILNTIQPYEENFMQAIKNLFNVFMSDKIDQKDVELWIKDIEQLDKKEMISAITDLLRWDFKSVLKEINKPIRSMIASRTLPNEDQRELHKQLFDTVFIEGVGHLMAVEDPKQFNKVLDELVTKLSG